MKYVGVLLVVAALSMTAQANSESSDIQQMMSDESVGEEIKPAELKGQYVGTCYDGDSIKNETLYFDAFANANGITSDLAISTAQTYGGYEMPSELAFLLKPSKKEYQNDYPNGERRNVRNR